MGLNEKFFDSIFKFFAVFWVLSALLSVVLTGVVIYAIIMLVQHFCK